MIAREQGDTVPTNTVESSIDERRDLRMVMPFIAPENLRCMHLHTQHIRHDDHETTQNVDHGRGDPCLLECRRPV